MLFRSLQEGSDYFISASDKAVSDNFGISVAINNSGTRIAVGAQLADVPGVNGTDSGKAYVFSYTSSSLPYFSGFKNEWPSLFGSDFNAERGTTITTSSNRQHTQLISDGTSSWWIA